MNRKREILSKPIKKQIGNFFNAFGMSLIRQTLLNH